MNGIKTFSLLIILSFLLLVAGASIGGEIGILGALIFAVIMNIGAYWYSDRIALKMAHAHPVEESSDPKLFNLVKTQCDRAQLPMPKIYKIESNVPNAFATGRNPKNATVAVTTGIQTTLNDSELGAVLAHEMAHVGNRDTLIMAVVATIAGAISMLAWIAQFSAMFSAFSGNRGGRNSNIVGLLFVAIVMPLAASIVRMAISRSREFQADLKGAHTSGDPLALADALEKLEQHNSSGAMKVPESASHLFIVNPFRGSSMSKLFSTHPPTEVRVKRLRELESEWRETIKKQQSD
ncbi:MAG TPA: protease HtpX [Dehalococcoidia bacterium]|nr:protease HtpX [Dehalococcoidia bacterium]